jgi:hypothetical protein
MNRVDKIENEFAEVYRENRRGVSLSADFTENVLQQVKSERLYNLFVQEKQALRASWITFAAAALVAFYFGITFSKNDISDELATAIYAEDFSSELLLLY